jgi:hypothetical protein
MLGPLVLYHSIHFHVHLHNSAKYICVQFHNVVNKEDCPLYTSHFTFNNEMYSFNVCHHLFVGILQIQTMLSGVKDEEQCHA